jgi:hypothetical protein
MTKHNAENERVKRAYLQHLKAALGLSEASVGATRDASGLNASPTARSPVAGTVDAVKPLHAQWPSSDEPRISR